MSKKRTKALTQSARAGLVAALLLILTGVWANAQAQDLSDKSVKVLMQYAWLILPAKFTTPTGKVIVVDKSKRDENMVPIDDARQIIKVARLSAHAQICNVPDAQAANFQTMMRSVAKKKLTDQQMLYVSQLHLFTVMWLTGNVKLVEHDGDKEVQLNEGSESSKERTCTAEERDKVVLLIKQYVCRTDPKHVIGCSS